MAGEDGGDLVGGGEAVGAGIGEAAVDAGEFSRGGMVGGGGEGGDDLLGMGGALGKGAGGPGGDAGEDVGEGAAGYAGRTSWS